MRIPIKEAVAELKARHGRDVKPGTVRRYIQEYCPHAKGSRGRGHAATVCVTEFLAWLDGDAAAHAAIAAAQHASQFFATRLFSFWRSVNGPSKRQLARILVDLWFNACSDIEDQHRERYGAAIGICTDLPAEIQHLRKIAQEN